MMAGRVDFPKSSVLSGNPRFALHGCRHFESTRKFFCAMEIEDGRLRHIPRGGIRRYYRTAHPVFRIRLRISAPYVYRNSHHRLGDLWHFVKEKGSLTLWATYLESIALRTTDIRVRGAPAGECAFVYPGTPEKLEPAARLRKFPEISAIPVRNVRTERRRTPPKLARPIPPRRY